MEYDYAGGATQAEAAELIAVGRELRPENTRSGARLIAWFPRERMAESVCLLASKDTEFLKQAHR